MRNTLVRVTVAGVLIAFIASGIMRIWGVSRAYANTTSSAESQKTDPELPFGKLNEIYEILQKRKLELDDREVKISAAEKKLDDARERIQKQLLELESAEEDLKKLIALSNEASSQDLEQLTQTYEAMKPKSAADLFSKMSPEFAAEFLVRMQPENAAAIFTNLESEIAYTISAFIASRNANAPSEILQ